MKDKEGEYILLLIEFGIVVVYSILAYYYPGDPIYFTPEECQTFETICEVLKNANPPILSRTNMTPELYEVFKTVFETCNRTDLPMTRDTKGYLSNLEYKSFKILYEIFYNNQA